MDDRFKPRPVAAWFVFAALASLLFMLLGCIALFMHVTADPAMLPLDQRVLFEAEPAWVVAASGVGFIAGALGSLLLLFRRKLGEPVLLLSLVAMMIWLAGMLGTPQFRNLLSPNQIALALAVVAVVWTIYWFARHSRQRRWLR